MECFSYVHCYIEQYFDEIFSTFYQSIHTASKAIGGFRGFKLLGFLVELIGIMIVWSLMMNFCKWITFPMFIVLLLHFFHEICTTFLELINTAIRSIDGFQICNFLVVWLNSENHSFLDFADEIVKVLFIAFWIVDNLIFLLVYVMHP